MKNSESFFAVALRQFRKNILALIGLIVIVVLIITATLAPWLTGYDRDAQDLYNVRSAPDDKHLLGTDELGRDVLTRLLYAGRVSLLVGLLSTIISVIIGVFLGATAGYFGGAADFFIMRLVDIFMSFPFFVIAITMAAILGPSIWNVMIIIGVLGWTQVARIVRAEVLSLKEREFVEAARAIGIESFAIISKHILPNILAVIIVYATLGIARGILSEAALSYLGLGVKQPMPSWGNMLSAAQNLQTLSRRWWLWVPPGILVFITVLSINFVGDGLRDAFDPKLKK